MGAIRLFLALVVVADHLTQFVLLPNHLHFSGYYKLGLSAPAAVLMFYVISGFLISTVLNAKYNDAREASSNSTSPE
jgi:peptidoglycan/LPS O-acetylase OafA/YrhL